MEGAWMISGTAQTAAGASGASGQGVSGLTGTVGTMQSGGAFTQMLVQIMQGAGSAGTTAPLGITLTPGLIAGAVQTETKPNGQFDALLEQLKQWLARLDQEGGADLQRLLDQAEFAAAVEQAELFVQQLLGAQPVSMMQNGQEGGAAGIPRVAPDLKTATEQIMQVLQAFVAAAEQQPEHPKVQQLLQTFGAHLRSLTHGTEQQGQASAQPDGGGNSNATRAAAQHLQPAFQTWQSYRPMKRIAFEQPASGGSEQLVQVTPDGGARTKLEALAAKAVLHLPVMTVISENESDAPASPTEAIAAHADTEDALTLPLHSSHRTPAGELQMKTDAPVVHARQFVQDMSQMLLRTMQVTSGDGFSEIKITLMPEHLGQVDVKVTLHNGQLVAQFVAESAHGKELLESQLTQLRAVLQSQGLQVDKLEVTQNQAAAYSMFQDQREQRSSRQFERKPSGKTAAEYDEMPVDFDAELAGLAAKRMMLGGSSFDVSA